MFYVILTCFVGFTSAANIFGMHVFPTESHHRFIFPIFKRLAESGHNVTIATYIPSKKSIPNITEIDLRFAKPVYDDFVYKIFMNPSIFYGYALKLIFDYFHLSSSICETIFQNNDIKNLLRNNKFDLIILEHTNVLSLVPALYHNTPVVAFSTLPGFLNTHDAVRNPTHPVLHPNFLLEIGDNPTFFERVRSVQYNLLFRLLQKFYDIPRCNKIAQKLVGNGIPSLEEVQNNISLAIFNGNSIMNQPRPLGPRSLDISRVQLHEERELPNDIKQFLDKSTRGVIYFSMGTNEVTHNLTKLRHNFIRDTLYELPYDVIWKENATNLGEIPSNFLVKEWLPQQDILRHPNLKLFVTQGGLHSLEESLVNGVPMVIIPIVVDQIHTAHRFEALKVAKTLDFFTMTKEELIQTIGEVLNDNEYRKKTHRLGRIITDVQVPSVDNVIWWIEYVIRHNGAPHLRRAQDIPFYQYYLLDVIAFEILIISVGFYISYKIIRVIISRKTKQVKKYKQK